MNDDWKAKVVINDQKAEKATFRKFIFDKQKESNKARKDSSKIGNFRGELYWQGKQAAFNEVMAYLGTEPRPYKHKQKKI